MASAPASSSPIEPGPVTNLALVPMGNGRWRFVISEGEFLAYAPRPVSAPQTLFRHDTPRSPTGARRGAGPGHGHHMAAAQGRWTAQLLALARMLRIEAAGV